MFWSMVLAAIGCCAYDAHLLVSIVQIVYQVFAKRLSMYVPKHFREDDLTILQELMRQYSFATLVSTQADGVPVATHLPVFLESEPVPYGTLKAHLALGNGQWRTFQE